MQAFLDCLMPGLLALAALLTLRRGENAHGLFLSGAREGLSILMTIFPGLLALLTAVGMLRASGADMLTAKLFGPVCRWTGIPEECMLLMLIRPLSGSGALAIGTELMKTYGVNSLIGRTAAVMLGSTETTFYAISVYFSAAGVDKTHHTVPAALAADFTGFFMAALTTRLWFGR